MFCLGEGVFVIKKYIYWHDKKLHWDRHKKKYGCSCFSKSYNFCFFNKELHGQTYHQSKNLYQKKKKITFSENKNLDKQVSKLNKEKIIDLYT